MLIFGSNISHQVVHGRMGTKRGVYSPCHRFDDLEMEQTMHDRIYMLTSYLSEGK